MKKISKKRKVINQKMNLSKKYDPKEAIKLIKDNSYVNFNESLDIAIKLSIDTSKTDQNIRGVINLPHGTGKKIRVAVMAKDEKAKEAKDAGADIVGDNDLSENIQKGNLDFDFLIATPDMMPTIGKLGKILGPKGLMPNPKLGTVTQDVAIAVKKAKSGQIQYRNDKSGIIHAGIGKLDFKEEHLFENLKVFYDAILKSKPDSVKKSKGSFIKKITIASTMGFGLEVNVESLR
jgi:large subunit ribosomal protein L1